MRVWSLVHFFVTFSGGSDAIGMGLNLNIDRIVFAEVGTYVAIILQ